MPDAIANFRNYVESLPRDTREMLAMAEDKSLPEDARRYIIAALNYLLQQFDLVPDWVPVIGLCDDAAVLRVAMALVAELDVEDLPVEQMKTIGRLANEAEDVRNMVGPEIQEALRLHVRSLGNKEVQHRTPDKVMKDARAMASWKTDLENYLRAYSPDLRPMQDSDKLKRDLLSYFHAKLGV